MAEFHPTSYSQQVEEALREVCPSTDPIDQPDFNPVDYINRQFPEERSLDALNAFTSNIQKRLAATEHELIDAVEAQATTASSAAKDLQTAREAVAGLHSRVTNIKVKAEQSEQMVNGICANIRQLDTAKTNLTESIRTLRNLQLFIMSLQNLSNAFEKKDFGKCYDNLRSAQSYSVRFEQYADAPKIKELRDKLTQLQKQIEFYMKANVFSDMRTENNDQTLAEACLVVDALGPEAVKKIRSKFISKELEVYGTLFRRGSEDARLERTERRYAFIRKLLDNNDHLFTDVFPTSWCVAQELCTEFCLLTHKELSYQLKEEAGTIDMAVLVFILQRTIEIEKDLTARMRWSVPEDQRKQLPDYKFYGHILSCFEDHMGLYIEHEDKAMAETISEQLREERWGDDNTNPREGATISSAEDLFVFIKESLKRVVTLSQQTTLAKMAEVWRKHLISYAEKLTALLPQPPNTLAEERRACLIINTAEMCRTTSESLAEEVTAKLDELLRPDFSFEAVSDSFGALFSAGILCVVSGFEKKICGALQDFASGNFAALIKANMDAHGGVMDESPYVANVRKAANEHIVNCALILPAQTLRFLLDKIVVNIVPRYTGMLYGLKRISENAVDQTMVDSRAIEKMFVQLPNAGNPNRIPPSMLTEYNRRVKREFTRMYGALKVLQCEVGERFVDHYYNSVAAEDRSLHDFSKLLELKGVKREDLRPWVAMLMKKNVPESTRRDAPPNTGGTSSAPVGNSGPPASSSGDGDDLKGQGRGSSEIFSQALKTKMRAAAQSVIFMGKKRPEVPQ